MSREHRVGEGKRIRVAVQLRSGDCSAMSTKTEK